MQNLSSHFFKMLILRKIIFYIFFFVYVILCPIIILYSLGFILRPASKTIIVETGNISLATVPGGASIYLNGEITDHKTAAVFDKLIPGTYQVKIALDGYQDWSANLPVEAGKAAVLDNIILLPDKESENLIIEACFQNLIPYLKAPYFLTTEGSLLKDYLIYNYKEAARLPLLEPDSTYALYKVIDYYCVKNSSSIIFKLISNKGENKFLWLNIKGQKIEPKDITALMPDSFLNLTWAADYETDLFALKNNSVIRIDISDEAVYPDYFTDVYGCGVKDGTIYLLKKENIIVSSDYSRNNIKSILDDPDLGSSIFGNSKYVNIIPFAKDIILFIDDKGALLSNHLPYKFVEGGVKDFRFDESSLRVLFWTKDQIGIIDFYEEEAGNIPFQKGPKFTWVYTKGLDIDQVHWVYDKSHVIFVDKNISYLMELEHYDERTPRLLTKIKDNTYLDYSDSQGILYFLDPKTGNLVSLAVLADRSPDISQEKHNKDKDGKNKEWNLDSQDTD